jgi:hypothetical protein
MQLHEIKDREAVAELLSPKPEKWQPALVALACACRPTVRAHSIMCRVCFHDDQTEH